MRESGVLRGVGKVRSFIGNSMGGVRGPTNLASWLVAGTLAYYLWLKPSQDLKKQQLEKLALAASDPNPYIQNNPHPQENGGVIYANKNKVNSNLKSEG